MTTKKMKCINTDPLKNVSSPEHLTRGKVYEVDPVVIQDSSGPCFKVRRDDGKWALTLCERFAEVMQEAPPHDIVTRMLCVDSNGAAHLTLGKVYDTRPGRADMHVDVFIPGTNSWIGYLSNRFIPDPSLTKAETPVAPAPKAEKPSPPPTFVCRCVICDKQLESVLGLMAIAYPYTEKVALARTSQGFDPELQVACEQCSAEIARLLAHKKKVSSATPLPDPEDFW